MQRRKQGCFSPRRTFQPVGQPEKPPAEAVAENDIATWLTAQLA